MISWLQQVDENVFQFINKTLALNWLYEVMRFLRHSTTWIPLYFFLLIFFAVRVKSYFLPIVLLSLLTFAITDFSSASILKPLIGRLRPCHEADLDFIVNNPMGCGGKFSMPSSHATNHFGLATFWFLAIRRLLLIAWYWLWIWAFIICFAQVYVGVHYPGDVLVGAVLGISVGFMVFFLLIRLVDKKQKAKMDEKQG